MSTTEVATERRGAVLVIRLLREHKRNAVNRPMAIGLDAAMNELDDDPDLRVGVITGTPTVFSAGTDMFDPADKTTPRGGEYGMIRRRRDRPLIAAVEGPALGGGFEIALSCDLVVAAEDARFGLPETRRGLVATSGALFRAPRALPRNVATELLLTGDDLTATRGAELGFVNRLCAPGTALPVAIELADRICRSSPAASAATLTALGELTAVADAAGWEATARARAAVLASPDAEEGRRAFAERRPASWAGR